MPRMALKVEGVEPTARLTSEFNPSGSLLDEMGSILDVMGSILDVEMSWI